MRKGIAANVCGLCLRSLDVSKFLLWGLGLQGVVTSLARRKTDGFDYHKLHQVRKAVTERSARFNVTDMDRRGRYDGLAPTIKGIYGAWVYRSLKEIV